MKIVLDTNVYIAAALRSGFSAEVFELIVTNYGFTAITSEEILAEIQEKLKNKFDWLQEDIDRFLVKVRKASEVVAIIEKVSIITRDPKDNKILECAVAGNADLIVTLDQDLIRLKSFRGIGIIHPRTLSWTFPEYFKKDN